MKKVLVFAAAATMMLSSCGVAMNEGATSTAANQTGNILGGILSTATSGDALGNILTSVLGMNKLSERTLVGNWKYSGPGCAFTSDNALAKAGGEVAASEIKSKLKSQYSKVGFSSSNTYLHLNSDHTFNAKIDGKSWSGTYTFNESTQQLKLTGLLINITGYTQATSNGISVLFESKKLLTLLQTMAAASGNQTATTIGTISKNYDGVRLGFEFKK